MKKKFIEECSEITGGEALSETLVNDFVIQIVKMFEIKKPNFFITVVRNHTDDRWDISDLVEIQFDVENKQIIATGGEIGVYTKVFKFDPDIFNFRVAS